MASMRCRTHGCHGCHGWLVQPCIAGQASSGTRAPGVLANDTDADGDPMGTAWVSNPAHGTLDLRVTGEFTYTPSGGYVGADSFQYKAYDPLAYSLQPATVTLEVADMKLYSVTFEEDNQVVEDPGVSAYTSPEWLDANLDGDADDLNGVNGTNDVVPWPVILIRPNVIGGSAEVAATISSP